jgi:hypothetical protein
MCEEFEMEIGADIQKYVKIAYDGVKEMPSAKD